MNQSAIAVRPLSISWLADLSASLVDDAASREYRTDPVTYARDVLKVKWWPAQVAIVEALLEHKRVLVKAGHSVGKSHLAGGLVNWFYDAYPIGQCITTAPTKNSVVDVIWKEIRLQRPIGLRHCLLPKAPRMESSPDHVAMGLTASSDAAFQGRHEQAVFLLYDECVGIQADYWIAGEAMMSSDVAYWLALCNPTDTASVAYDECISSGKWHVIDISCLDHPNIAAELAGKPKPYPKAVDLAWVQGRLKEWCEPITSEDRRSRDFEFPKGTGTWYRPGPLGESRLLGRWPSTGATSVWSDAAWQASMTPQELSAEGVTYIGCDKARFGDDFTSFVVRRDNCVLHHETHNGWDNNQIAGRLKQLAERFHAEGEDPKKVRCQVDDVQGGVIDLAAGYDFKEVNSASNAVQKRDYPNKRSELWFTVAERADAGDLDLSRLSPQSRILLRSQCMSPTWKVDSQGRREVEKKADTKKRLKRSPDDADALNLAFALPPQVNRVERTSGTVRKKFTFA